MSTFSDLFISFDLFQEVMPRPWHPDAERSMPRRSFIFYRDGFSWTCLVTFGGCEYPLVLMADHPSTFPGRFLLTSPFLWSIWDHLGWPPTTDSLTSSGFTIRPWKGYVRPGVILFNGKPNGSMSLCTVENVFHGFRGSLKHTFLWPWAKGVATPSSSFLAKCQQSWKKSFYLYFLSADSRIEFH